MNNGAVGDVSCFLAHVCFRICYYVIATAVTSDGAVASYHVFYIITLSLLILLFDICCYFVTSMWALDGIHYVVINKTITF